MIWSYTIVMWSFYKCSYFWGYTIEFAETLIIKPGDKSCIVLYICSIYGVVYLVLVFTLSIDSFFSSLRRLVARGGRPKIIYFDNNTNSQASDCNLSRIQWSELMPCSEVHRIIWMFYTSSGICYCAGCERFVRVVKWSLTRRYRSKNYKQFYVIEKWL